MTAIQFLAFAASLAFIVVGLAYLLEIRNPLRNWILTVVVLVPVGVFVALLIFQA
jgi:hypothetical protein